jgi:hypothetical protein
MWMDAGGLRTTEEFKFETIHNQQSAPKTLKIYDNSVKNVEMYAIIK